MGSFAQDFSLCPVVMTSDVPISMPSLCLEHWLGHIHIAQQDAGKESWKKKQFFSSYFCFMNNKITWQHETPQATFQTIWSSLGNVLFVLDKN